MGTCERARAFLHDTSRAARIRRSPSLSQASDQHPHQLRAIALFLASLYALLHVVNHLLSVRNGPGELIKGHERTRRPLTGRIMYVPEAGSYTKDPDYSAQTMSLLRDITCGSARSAIFWSSPRQATRRTVGRDTRVKSAWKRA